MGPACTLRIILLLGVVLSCARAQVIEFESNGLKFQALTRNGLTVMVAQLPASVRDYTTFQVAVSNGGERPQTVRPEDFLFIREDGTEVQATPARAVVDSLMERASRNDVIRLITSYENSVYGNPRFRATNGYEARRQSALTTFASAKLHAAAAASAIVFVQTKLMPGQSTDGAVFLQTGGKPLGPGTVRVRAGGALYEFPLISSNQTVSQSP